MEVEATPSLSPDRHAPARPIPALQRKSIPATGHRPCMGSKQHNPRSEADSETPDACPAWAAMNAQAGGGDVGKKLAGAARFFKVMETRETCKPGTAKQCAYKHKIRALLEVDRSERFRTQSYCNISRGFHPPCGLNLTGLLPKVCLWHQPLKHRLQSPFPRHPARPPARSTSVDHAMNDMKSAKHRFFTRFFTPRYDELALYLMSCAFVILLLIDPDLESWLNRVLTEDPFAEFMHLYLIGIVIFVTGMAYSLYHAFTTREKTEWEKTAMLFFAVIVNSTAGIVAGVYILKDSQGLLVLFPLWNIVNGIILLFLYKSRMVDDTCIADDDATLLQVVVGTIVVVSFILVGKFVFDMYWAISFSICVAFSSNVSRVVQSIVLWTRHEDGGADKPSR